MSLHWNILDDKRRALLPLFKTFSDQGFYLAGGTGLALQLGHRDSVDFDFFTEREYDAKALVEQIETVFKGHEVSITQAEKNTVSCIIDGVQLSFFGYRYPLVEPLVAADYFTIASIKDIGCMKLAAITGRSVEKDYIDLYFILKNVPLKELVSLSTQKHPALDPTLVLKSLVYFDDVLREPVLFKEGHEVSFDAVKKNLQEAAQFYFKK